MVTGSHVPAATLAVSRAVPCISLGDRGKCKSREVDIDRLAAHHQAPGGEFVDGVEDPLGCRRQCTRGAGARALLGGRHSGRGKRLFRVALCEGGIAGPSTCRGAVDADRGTRTHRLRLIERGRVVGARRSAQRRQRRVRQLCVREDRLDGGCRVCFRHQDAVGGNTSITGRAFRGVGGAFAGGLGSALKHLQRRCRTCKREDAVEGGHLRQPAKALRLNERGT